MTQVILIALLIGVALAAIAGAYRTIRADGGPRRTPLPAEPSEGNTILPYPRRSRNESRGIGRVGDACPT
jgi:hypothetical protein